MKKENTLLLLVLLFQASIGAYAQYVNNEENGIHVSGGWSSQEYASSNIGTDCEARGLHAFAAGCESKALGHSAFAIGYKCQGMGTNTYVFGDCAYAEQPNSMALGAYVKSLGSTCIVLGAGHGSNTPLTCSTSGIAMGINSTVPTLFISQSNGNYKTGRVAIGNATEPQAKLHIVADENEDAGIILEPSDLENSNTFIRMRDENHGIEVDNLGNMSINAGENPLDVQSSNITLNSKVGINTTNESDTYALAVDGGILTNEVLIKEVDDWYDHVFAKDYNLLSLSDLQQFIAKHGHLPEVPSEAEVKEEGYKMAELQGLLLKKIEELTLYTLKQQELIEKLEQRIDELERK